MRFQEKIEERLSQLIGLGNDIKRTACPNGKGHPDIDVDYEMSSQWYVSSITFLRQVFGTDSDYCARFERYSDGYSNSEVMDMLQGTLKAALDDVEKGWFVRTQTLIQAELFADFLDQASHLLDKGYHGPAAVLAGAVLEDGLRKLCERNDIELPDKPKLDWMNTQLVRAEVFSKFWQKRITALAQIRNDAAHGKWDQFTEDDVKSMIDDVGRFMARYFGE